MFNQFISVRSAALLSVLCAGLVAAAAKPVTAEATTRYSNKRSELLIADNHTGSEHMSEPMTESMSEPMSSSTIVDVASNSESFDILVQALQATDLVSTLSSSENYTVFAPTDEAFEQLPEGALDYLLQPENEDLLRQVLTYHVVPGEITASELSTGGIDALGGGLAVGVFDSGVVINNASVTNANIQADNGIVHAINRVLVPATLQQQLASRLGVSSLYQ